ncbi:MAG TPA: DUF6468 domain-containing protein [Candidatus Sulfotelmatobacter sp.]|jgi:hypothetical protein|nr:DUF6468 domain-containing protein [Candidatus Sulfotelmatobacter sp.]
MEDYKLILDVIVAILLAATIAYAWILNRRLGDLRRNRDEMARLVNAFNDATARAEAGIPKLRRAADEAGATLQERVEKAQTLRDDLAFMIERAEAMANRLEGTVRQARDVKIPPSAPAPGPAAQPAMNAGAMGGAPSMGQPAAAPRSGMAPRPQPSPQQPVPSASQTQPSHSQPHFGPLGDEVYDDERSEAERELLRALQSVR